MSEAVFTTNEEPGSSGAPNDTESGTTNGDANDKSMMDVDGEDDVANTWEMLELARSILLERIQDGGAEWTRALSAEAHLLLGEDALENRIYEIPVEDMLIDLDIQKDPYDADNRRIAETHFQIGLAKSLASKFDQAITHFKNAANIYQTRIKTLRDLSEDAIKKYSADPTYKAEPELEALLPEIQEKIQDMFDCNVETIKRLRESLITANGEGSSNGASSSFTSSSSSADKPAADISLLKRKASEGEADSSAKRKNI